MKAARLAAALFAFACSAFCHADPLTYSCGSIAEESDSISRLGVGTARRASPHRLTINTAKGAVSFVDQAPHDEPFAGVHYWFCDRHDGYMLIGVQRDALFTGELVNESTGAVIKAGASVSFSPDRSAYLAEEQPDGLDGEQWSVHAADGRALWSGYSFIPRGGNGDEIEIELEQPAWQADGELVANAACAGSTAVWPVRLIERQGQWSWQPRRPCPPA